MFGWHTDCHRHPYVEREFVGTWLDRRELDYLIYNDPDSYAELVLDGDVKEYLDTFRQRHQLRKGVRSTHTLRFADQIVLHSSNACLRVHLILRAILT